MLHSISRPTWTCSCTMWPWPFEINGFPGLLVEHLHVMFDDPSCIGFWDIVRISKQTDRQADSQADSQSDRQTLVIILSPLSARVTCIPLYHPGSYILFSFCLLYRTVSADGCLSGKTTAVLSSTKNHVLHRQRRLWVSRSSESHDRLAASTCSLKVDLIIPLPAISETQHHQLNITRQSPKQWKHQRVTLNTPLWIIPLDPEKVKTDGPNQRLNRVWSFDPWTDPVSERS